VIVQVFVGNVLRQLLPVGAQRLMEVRATLGALGLPKGLALSRSWRDALMATRIELVPPHVRSNAQVVVDVGANVGDWTIGICKLLRPRRAIAFEPIPSSFDVLARRTGSLSGVELVRAAVGAKVGTIEMFSEAMHQLSSVRRLRTEMRQLHGVLGTSPTKLTVPMTTLDEHLAETTEISLLKIDVQGFEREVLEGARKSLLRTRAVMLEVLYVPYYEGDSQFGELHRHLTSIAPFRLYGVSAPSMDEARRPIWADAVYVQGTE
jgi:FkbM family methyltransferase